jgi:8-amino-7-oxononanoate synthase
MKYPQFERRVERHVRELENAGLRRSLAPPSGLDLSSNDYLGLSTHPLLKQRMAEAVWTEGCGATASRLLRGDRECFANVERRFADFKNSEAALYFGSGYAANLSVLGTFIERNDIVLSDDRNHASIIDGIRLSRAKRTKFPHCNVDRVAKLLREAPADRARFLITESLFSMDGDFAPLEDYAELCRETGTALIVDEAHAVGIYGKQGSGLVEQTGTAESVFITVNTAGKAMGVAGAFVAGPSWAIDYLIQRARPFIFSTAPPPCVAAALDASMTVIQREPERRERLLKHSALLRGLLGELGIQTGSSHSQIISVVLEDNDRASSVAENLQREGFDVRAIRPPTVPPGTARLRVSVNSTLEESALQRFARALERVLREGISCSVVCL